MNESRFSEKFVNVYGSHSVCWKKLEKSLSGELQSTAHEAYIHIDLLVKEIKQKNKNEKNKPSISPFQTQVAASEELPVSVTPIDSRYREHFCKSYVKNYSDIQLTIKKFLMNKALSRIQMMEPSSFNCIVSGPRGCEKRS